MTRAKTNSIPTYLAWTGRPVGRTCAVDDRTAKIVRKIRELAESHQNRDDQELASDVERLRRQVAQDEPITSCEIVMRSFALTTEALRRTLGYTFYDVQLASGLVLASGAIAEIQTGEGKTIVTGASSGAVRFGRPGRPCCDHQRVPLRP